MEQEPKGMVENLADIQFEYKNSSAEALKRDIASHIRYSLSKDQFSATQRDLLDAVCRTMRDRLIERWLKTQQAGYRVDSKRIYYLSMEFLIGRTLGNSLLNLEMTDECARALQDLGAQLEIIQEAEWDPGLGNGGLGRLAACYLDSMATLELPTYGYGIRYEYGIFFQHLVNGYQIETPDNWLRYGNPWEIPRPEHLYQVHFYGRVEPYVDQMGRSGYKWADTQSVMAMAYDTPIPGYNNDVVNTMRLWSAKSTREFDLEYFNHGDYVQAVADKNTSENISRVLYPNDNSMQGKELRLKQEYFFVSATLQDIVRRYKKSHDSFDQFPDKVAIQLNDTHPAIAVADLMRILVDEEYLSWEEAWEITTHTFAYTNHTILPEALEKWSISLMELVLPRHLQIINEINRRFLWTLNQLNSREYSLQSMSLIDEEHVHMARLAIVGSHSINGVSALHTDIIRRDLFSDFYEIYPERFKNVTNGVTQRRWLKLCNPGLSQLISSYMGDSWVTRLEDLSQLEQWVDDAGFQQQWWQVKQSNKAILVQYIHEMYDLQVPLNSIFDIQIKRIHEYKRQLLNILHLITLYNRMKAEPTQPWVPRTVIMAGKAAPGYHMAKLIIKLFNSVAAIINRDPDMAGRLAAIFLANYNVSLAEKIIPATELSEQISTAGWEASGTGNMKLALNGALTIGTLDGANVEMLQEIGAENMFIFGMNAEEVKQRQKNYYPRDYLESNAELYRCIDMMTRGFFSPEQPDLFHPIVHSLLNSDRYMVFADYTDYICCQEIVSQCYLDQTAWTRQSILNTARMGYFSSDRSVREYAQNIWEVQPLFNRWS